MAPVIRSYSKKHANKTALEAFDALFAKNIKKRNKARADKLKIRALPPPASSTVISSDDSLRVNVRKENSIFDKVKDGSIYNKVHLKNGPVYNTSGSDISKSKLQLSVEISNCVRSPVIKKKKRKLATKLKQNILTLQSSRKETTLDKPVYSSLEKEKFEFSSNLLCCSSLNDVSSQALQASADKSKLCSYENIFRNTKGNLKICSTPLTLNDYNATLNLGVSPIKPVLNAETKDCKNETPRKPREKTSSRGRRISKFNDPKLHMRPFVRLSNSMHILGIENKLVLTNSFDCTGFTREEQNDGNELINTFDNFISSYELSTFNMLVDAYKVPRVNVTRLSDSAIDEYLHKKKDRRRMKSCFVILTPLKYNNTKNTSSCSKNEDDSVFTFVNVSESKTIDRVTRRRRYTPKPISNSTHNSSVALSPDVYVTLRSRKVNISEKSFKNVQNSIEKRNNNSTNMSDNSIDASKIIAGDASGLNCIEDNLIVIDNTNSFVNCTSDKGKENVQVKINLSQKSTGRINTNDLNGVREIEEESLILIDDTDCFVNYTQNNTCNGDIKKEIISKGSISPELFSDSDNDSAKIPVSNKNLETVEENEKLNISPQKCSITESPASKPKPIEESKSTNNITRDSFKFAVPNMDTIAPRRKSIVLKPGKSYRRSIFLLRQSASILECFEDQCKAGQGAFCACLKCKAQESRKNPRRLTIRIIPASPIKEDKKNVTALENYAANISYVSDATEKDKILEQTVRDLSICIRNSLVLNKTPAFTARDIVLRRCGQTDPIPFKKCYPDTILQHCHKIGEGVYGEVFLLRNGNGGTSVVKIIPIEGTRIVNGDRQKKFEEILSEMIIAMELSDLRNNVTNFTTAFSEVQKIRCVQGRYPDRLLELWELYDEDRGSENDSPEIFDDNQLYIVLELANGGKDMEAFIFNNAQQSFALFKQTACALAVAESAMQFEHRDLHWGNILITMCDKNKKAKFRLDGTNIEIPTYGVQVCVIDFTMSRITHDGVIIYNDLSQDEELFTAIGDYQFEVYRLMQERNGNDWQHFEPYTNIVWLHYVLDKMLKGVHYKNVASKIHTNYMNKLKEIKDTILSFDSVKQFVMSIFL